MLDEMLPVQFIEGVNENPRSPSYAIANYMIVLDDQVAAIRYIPKTTYTLKKIEIFLSTNSTTMQAKCALALCTDHEDQPSDIVLTTGNLATTDGLRWQAATVLPVVVVAKNKYWITIALEEGSVKLPGVDEGADIPLKFKQGGKWIIEPVWKSWRVAIRFYGRFLP